MLHLTLDTDIWLNSLIEDGEEDNFIDAVDYWVKNNQVQILLPENIVEEWSRNREAKKQVLVRDWRKFFEKAKTIFDNEIIKTLKTPDSINTLVEVRLKKVEDIFERYAIKIPITDTHKIKAADLAILKKAPFGSKNSMGDAFNYLATTDYIQSNSLSNCVFLTGNYTDFSDPKNRDMVHSDFGEELQKLNVKYYNNVRKFCHDYSKILPNYSEYRRSKALEEQDKKLATAVLNPETLSKLEGLTDSYIENINHLDKIIRTNSPTKEQVAFSIGLINSDLSYKTYFFRKLEQPIWFDILKSEGYLNTETNPSPVKSSEGGYQIPHWLPLNYLERISIQVKNGQCTNLIEGLLDTIKKLIDNPKDNYVTWYFVAKILDNIPNDKIDIDVLKFISVALNTKFEATLISSVICENLLPKFLNSDPSPEDIAKAESILTQLFNLGGLDDESSESKVNVYYLKNAFENNELSYRVAKYCSPRILSVLTLSIKKFKLNFPEGLTFKIKGSEGVYKLNTKIVKNDLCIIISEESIKEIDKTEIISDYEKLTSKEIINKYYELIKKHIQNAVVDNDCEVSINSISYSLDHGTYYANTNDSFFDLNIRGSENTIELFLAILKEVTINLMELRPVEGEKILNDLLYNTNYKLFVFKKIVFSIIGMTFGKSQNIFWDYLKKEQALTYINDYSTSKDIYDLLSKIQFEIGDKTSLLEKVINNDLAKVNTKLKVEEIDYLKLKWYSAVRRVAPFTDKYEEYSKKLNITFSEFEERGGLFIANKSPKISIVEIFRKPHSEIGYFLQSYKPESFWEEPTVDTIANELSKVIQSDPDKFAKELDNYRDLYYIYSYHIINSFRDSWKGQKTFDWKKVLEFCDYYVTSKKFIDGELNLVNDGWGASKGWVFGAIGNLLTTGMQSDSNAFDLELLPIAKSIVLKLVDQLLFVDDFKKSNMDYVTYSLNSVAGKVLRGFLDYNLRYARNLVDKDDSSKWEDEMKKAFESAFEKKIVDPYILLGWYFPQFNYLDKAWTEKKVKDVYKVEDKYWLGFMHGYTFSNPPFDKDVYELMYDHYEKALKNNVQLNKSHDNGVTRHIVTFYFWGYEDLNSEKLLFYLLNASDKTGLKELINFIWRQESYYNQITVKEEKEKFLQRVIDLWKYLVNKYENSEVQDEKDILSSLSTFITFVPILNDQYTQLTVKSIVHAKDYFYPHYLIENLKRLQQFGEKKETAGYIGSIMNAMQIHPTYAGNDNKMIEELVVFLYENDQKTIANQICNSIAKQGHEFLIQIHNSYNS